MNPKINLLVIDDDDINIFIIRKIVEKTGYNVEMTAKSNGQLAIEYLKDIKKETDFPGLILIDINMPILNGWEFIEAYERLHASSPKVKVYILSSSVYENDIEKAKSYKTVKGFITKPLSIERLTELLNTGSVLPD